MSAELRKLAQQYYLGGYPGIVVQLGRALDTGIELKAPESFSQEFRPFTPHEEKVLTEDGVHFIDLKGETIQAQEEAKREISYVADRRDILLKAPSMIARVGIYPDPARFFIPNSGSKDLLTLKDLAKKDGQDLRERLGLEDEGVDVIIPDQASTFTELTFKYLDETTKKGKGVWLFGPDYDCRSGITKNLIYESGFDVAAIFSGYPDGGVHVDSWNSINVIFSVVRLIVAKKK